MYKLLLSATLAATLLGGSAYAQTTQLKFAFPATPKSPLMGRGMVPWANDVNKAAGGAINIKVFGGPVLGTFRNIYDRTLKGVADIAFGVHGQVGGKFPQSFISALPFESRNSVESSLAFWRLFDKGLIAGEYANLKLLALFHFPHSSIHTQKKVTRMADLKGLKLTASSRIVAKIAAKLGIVPIAMPPPNAYQSINRGVTSGSLFAWTAVGTFRIYEVTKYHLQAPLAASPAFVIMNKKRYAGLPTKGRRAIDRFSGEVFSRRLGGVTNGMEKFNIAKVKKLPGHVFTKIAADDLPQWIKIAGEISTAAAKEAPNGTKVLEAFRAEIKSIRGGK
jgi:TRAP-type C4-dicarboxylate transport system substrate-binding protein